MERVQWILEEASNMVRGGAGSLSHGERHGSWFLRLEETVEGVVYMGTVAVTPLDGVLVRLESQAAVTDESAWSSVTLYRRKRTVNRLTPELLIAQLFEVKEHAWALTPAIPYRIFGERQTGPFDG